MNFQLFKKWKDKTPWVHTLN